jgi:high-affinity nickel-transport protein
MRDLAGQIGMLLSASFLLLIAMANLLILRGVWRDFVLARAGGAAGALMVGPTGPLASVLRPVLRAVTRSWHMYPVGFLFAVGFDTATEVGLLGLSATQTAQGLTLWQIMIFPALFTAGMALVDAADSVLMVGAYGWAFAQPVRKLYYNLTITFASVLVALLIGGIELLGLVVDHLHLTGALWLRLAALNDQVGSLGYAVIAIFGASWIGAMVIYRIKRYGEIEARSGS